MFLQDWEASWVMSGDKRAVGAWEHISWLLSYWTCSAAGKHNMPSQVRRWLQLRFDLDSTLVRPRYDHSTTYITTGLSKYGQRVSGPCYVTVTLMSFDKPSNDRRSPVHSKLNRRCNRRVSNYAVNPCTANRSLTLFGNTVGFNNVGPMAITFCSPLLSGVRRRSSIGIPCKT